MLIPGNPRGWILLLLVACAQAAVATTIVPMSVDDLTAGAEVVVRATVSRVTPRLRADGHIERHVGLHVDEVLTGILPDTDIELVEDGGELADITEVIDGAPQYEAGETALVFLAHRRDGSWRTHQLSLGKFPVALDTSRRAGRWNVAIPPGIISNGTMRLNGVEVDTTADYSAAFSLSGPSHGRFFEPDEGISVPFLIDGHGDALLGLATARRLVNSAFGKWNGAGGTIDLSDGGLDATVTLDCPGPNRVIFNDPSDRIPPPTNCMGVLALGGFQFATSETKHFDGTNFVRTRCASLTFANGWAECGVWNECNVAEIATHELGHTLGLGHSSERSPEPDASLRDATMYYRAHFDGRCASVRDDDIAGVQFLYPATLPPTITTAAQLPKGKSGKPYSQQLDATGGSSSFQWTLASTNVTGLQLSTNGLLSGTPSFAGNGFVRATVTDTNGDSHTKVFTITVDLGPVTFTPTRTQSARPTATPTITATRLPTALPTLTPTTTTPPTSTSVPTFSATATPSPTATQADTATPTTVAQPCPGDCNGDHEVTIDELVTLVQAALEGSAPAACHAGDTNSDQTITIDEILAAVTRALSGC